MSRARLAPVRARPFERLASPVGLTLVDLLVATCVSLATLAAVTAALPPVLDVMGTVPEATDLHQRARAAESVLSSVIGVAGAGADLLGEGPLPHGVPALLPRRVGVSADAPASAWGDRLTALQVPERAAQAPLAQTVWPGSTTALLAWHPACGVHPSCGFRRGDLALLYARDGAMALTMLTAVAGLAVTLETPPDQAIGLPAHIAAVTTTTFFFDAARRHLRRADGVASSQPVIDEVVGLSMRYYGSAAAPRWPAIPGVATCAVAADGTPMLPTLGPAPGPPVELTLAQFMDGPWCGSGAWAFDADLLRVRAVRVAIRLQAAAQGVRGLAPAWFAIPGSARRVGQQVRDIELDAFFTAPNLAWGQ